MTLRRPTRRAALIGGGLGLAVLTAGGLAISLHTTASQLALDAVNSSASWRSSTAFSDWLSEHGELAAALDDSERDQLAVGDIVQFDWDNSGDPDHTGIVTRIDHNADGSISVYYAGHTDNTLLRSVD